VRDRRSTGSGRFVYELRAKPDSNDMDSLNGVWAQELCGCHISAAFCHLACVVGLCLPFYCADLILFVHEIGAATGDACR
jgi:hypothetical protein